MESRNTYSIKEVLALYKVVREVTFEPSCLCIVRTTGQVAQALVGDSTVFGGLIPGDQFCEGTDSPNRLRRWFKTVEKASRTVFDSVTTEKKRVKSNHVGGSARVNGISFSRLVAISKQASQTQVLLPVRVSSLGRVTLTDGTSGLALLQAMDPLKLTTCYAPKSKQLYVAKEEPDDSKRQQMAPVVEDTRSTHTFLSYILHEVRNPLNTISLGLSRLECLCPEEKLADLSEINQVLRVLRSSVIRARHVLDNTIDLSRIEQGMFSLDKSLMDLNELLEDSLSQARNAVEAKEISLSYTRQLESVVVEGDWIRLEQVVANLLNNATKFTPRAGRIDVSLKSVSWYTALEEFPPVGDHVAASSRFSEDHPPEALVVSVSDNGHGISAENLQRLFQPYVQIAPGEQQQGRGAGLGLVISKKIVEGHGGWVSIKSKLGEGTTISFTLPYLDNDSSLVRVDSRNSTRSRDELESTDSHTSSHASLEQPATTDLSGMHILLVEDDETISRLMMMLLQKLNAASIKTLANGQEFVDYVSSISDSSVRFVTLLDDVMPVLSGKEALRVVRAGGFRQPIVMCSGNASLEDVKCYTSLGADATLSKPVDVARLVRVLRSTVQSACKDK